MGKTTKLTIDIVKQWLINNDLSNDYTLLSDEYINNKAPLYFKHLTCGTIFKRNYNHLMRFHLCNNKECVKLKRDLTIINTPNYWENRQSKTVNTLIKKFSVTNISQIEEVKNIKKKIFIEKYNVCSPLQLPYVREKVKATNLKKFGVEYPLQSKVILNKIQSIPFGFQLEHIRDIAYLKNKPIKQSKPELEIINFIKTFYSGAIIHGTRKVISPYELDIYLPELNIAIEFNGTYWHSEQVIQKNKKMSAKEYHDIKFNRCSVLNINLIFIEEKDWVDTKNIIKDKLYIKIMEMING